MGMTFPKTFLYYFGDLFVKFLSKRNIYTHIHPHIYTLIHIHVYTFVVYYRFKYILYIYIIYIVVIYTYISLLLSPFYSSIKMISLIS